MLGHIESPYYATAKRTMLRCVEGTDWWAVALDLMIVILNLLIAVAVFVILLFPFMFNWALIVILFYDGAAKGDPFGNVMIILIVPLMDLCILISCFRS